MSDIQLEIDGIQVTAKEGMTLLEAAQTQGIYIPTLCHHEKLEPFGGCRVCIVEVEERGWTKLVVSCVFPVKNGIIVRTRSEKVDRIRKTIIELLMAHAPDAPELVKMAKEYGAIPDRFEKHASFCVHCGLCVRYCAEVVKKMRSGLLIAGSTKRSVLSRKLQQRNAMTAKNAFHFARHRIYRLLLYIPRPCRSLKPFRMNSGSASAPDTIDCH